MTPLTRLVLDWWTARAGLSLANSSGAGALIGCRPGRGMPVDSKLPGILDACPAPRLLCRSALRFLAMMNKQAARRRRQAWAGPKDEARARDTSAKRGDSAKDTAESREGAKRRGNTAQEGEYLSVWTWQASSGWRPTCVGPVIHSPNSENTNCSGHT